MNLEIQNQFGKVVGSDNVDADVPMSENTTFGIGGPANFLVTPHSVKELVSVLAICKEEDIDYMILGRGSNLLVGDKGYDGAMIRIYKNMSLIDVEDTIIEAEAGALLSKIAKVALSHELTGMEFAAGIPGTLGGGIVMNAGAYDGELKDILLDVTILTKDGQVKVVSAKDLELGYRTSNVIKNEYTILKARLSLKKGKAEDIKALMDDLQERRSSKQPLEYPSAGSVFKRPKDNFAGKLIMEAGLQGYYRGGAQVSKKHAGFIINTGEATAKDVQELIEYIIRIVKHREGITLETEVKMVGDF